MPPRRLVHAANDGKDGCLDDDECLGAAATTATPRPLVPATGGDREDTQHGLIAVFELEREKENSLSEQERRGKREEKVFFYYYFSQRFFFRFFSK